MAQDFSMFIKQQQVKQVSNSNGTTTQYSNSRMRRSTAETNAKPEKICVIQIGRNAQGATFAYAIEGGFSAGKEVIDTKNMTTAPFPEGATREMLLSGIAQLATAIIEKNTVANRKTNLRLIVYDNMAIKHFAMLSAQKNQEDPVERMCKNFNYSEGTVEVLRKYCEAVNNYLNTTNKLLFVETYRSQLYWDIIVPEEANKIEAGTILKFNGNDCVSVPGIRFAQGWHRGVAQYAVHVDMATKYDDNGSIVLDDNGEPVMYARSFAVVRPTIEKNGRRVPKNAKCYFITEKMADYAKNHLPETAVISGDEAADAMADFM